MLPPIAQPNTNRNAKSETKTIGTSQAEHSSNDENDSNEEKPNNGWPGLIPLDSPSLPKLPSTALPGFAGSFVRALSAATETPIELASGMVLTTCATAVARRMVVAVEPGYIEPCNIWIIVALTSGSRKSANQSAATAPLVTWERDQGASMAPEIKSIASKRKTMEARVKRLRNKAANATDASKAKEFAKEAAEIETKLPEIPQPPQMWTSDATPERMGSLLAENDECMAWLSSAGGIFELIGGRYSTKGIPNLDLVLKAHSGDSERVDRGSRPPIFLLHPLLTIGLSPQPDVLRGLASMPGFRGRGLLARFLYFLPESKLGYRKLETIPISKTVQKVYADGITVMLNWEPDQDRKGHACRHVVRLSKGACEKRLKYAKDIEIEMRPGESMEHVTDWAGKAPGAVVRIAGVLHGIEHARGEPWTHEITEDTMSAAIEIMEVIAPHSLAALDLMGADSGIAAARHVWSWIERSSLVVFTIREAFNALKGTFPRVKNVVAALKVLEERGYVEIQPVNQTGGPGRPPSPTVLVRPDIFK